MPPDAHLKTVLPDSAEVVDGRLTVAGCNLSELARHFGTPLYIYDERTLRNQARITRAAFESKSARISFAAKACGTIGVLRVFAEEGLGLDVVSLGELRAGLLAGFPGGRIHLHGNAKSYDELEAALHARVHAVVLDNLEEIDRLEDICRRLGHGVDVMVRVSLPLEAETHPHLQTSGRSTKFGFSAESQDEEEAFARLESSAGLRLRGIHVHLGSQIADVDIYERAAHQMRATADKLIRRGHAIREVSVGGGWAVAYQPSGPSIAAAQIADAVTPSFRDSGMTVAVEPGRALVARAAIALYQVVSVKRSARGRLIAVDGGMGDNPRPALYGAGYTAFVPDRVNVPPASPADLVGRFCEAGDVLVREAHLPDVSTGDLVCVPVSGAYQLSMVSAYNLVPAPAAVMVLDGTARLLARRGTVEELLARDVRD